MDIEKLIESAEHCNLGACADCPSRDRVCCKERTMGELAQEVRRLKTENTQLEARLERVKANELVRKQTIKQAVQEAVDDVAVQLTKKALMLAVCSIADAYGFGPEQMQQFFEFLEKNTEELKNMRKEVDDNYAYEKLRLKVERVTGASIV